MSIAMDMVERLEAGSDVFSFTSEPYTPVRVPPGTWPDQAQSQDWDPDRAVKEGLKVCSTLSSVISRLAKKSASVPWRWWSDAGVDAAGRRAPAEAGGLVEWIEYPTKIDGRPETPDRFETRAGMMQEAITDLMTAGECFIGQLWEGVTPRPGRVPRELRIEAPKGVSPVVDKKNRLIGWEWYSEAGGVNYWDAADIIQVRWMTDPANRWRGLSPLQALGLEVDTFVEILKRQHGRMARGAAPGEIVKAPGVTDDVVRRRIEENLNRSAAKTFGQFMVIGGDQEVVSRSAFNAAQLQLLETAAFLRDDIWVAYGLHPALGSSDASTLNNMHVAHEQEWQAAKILNEAFAQQFTARWVKPQDRGKVWIAPDYRDIEVLNQTQQKVDRLDTLINQCRRSPADAIRFLRLPFATTAEDEVPLVGDNLIPVGAAISGEGAEV